MSSTEDMWLGGLWASNTGSRCMETTIRSVISSPSISGNDPRLSYIWMYVSRDIYRDTYLDIWVRRVIIIIRCPLYFNPDSSDDSGYVLVMFPVIVSVMCTCYDSCLSSGYDSYYTCYGPMIIIVMYSCFDYRMNCNSDSIRLDIRWHETKVYTWGFPCLDYSFDVLVSWDRDLSVYNHFCL